MYIDYYQYSNDKTDKVDLISGGTEGCAAGAEGYAETSLTRSKLRPHKIYQQVLEKRGNFMNMKSSFESTLALTTNPFQCILVPVDANRSFGTYLATSDGEPYFTHGFGTSGKQTQDTRKMPCVSNHSCQDGEACAHQNSTVFELLSGGIQTTSGSIATRTKPEEVAKRHFHGNHLCQGGEACTFQELSLEESDSEPDSDLLEDMASSFKSNHPILNDIIQRNLKKLDISNTRGNKDAFQIEIDLQRLENTYGHEKINESLTFTT